MPSVLIASLFFLLWVVTLVFFIVYLLGHRKRHKKTIENFIADRDVNFAALRKSEERYNKLITHMNVGLMFINDKDQICFVNRCVCNILKLNSEKLINHSIYDFFLSPSDNRKLKLPYELKKPGCSHREEIQLVRGNGDIFWAALNISYLDSLHNHMPGSIIIITDIDDQKKAEEKLHNLTVSLNHKVNQLDSLFEISDISFIPDASLEEVLQRSLGIIPLGLKNSANIWVEINAGNKQYKTKNYKDSKLFFMTPIKGGKRNFGTLRVGNSEIDDLRSKDVFHVNERIFIRNIAQKLGRMIEMKNMEQSMEESLEKLKEFQNIARIGTWEMDLSNGHLSFGPNFFDVMGTDPANRTSYGGETFYQQVYPKDQSMIRGFEKRILSGNLNDLAHAYRIKTSKGQMRYIFGNGKLLYDAENKPCTILGTIQDITAQVNKLKDLQKE